MARFRELVFAALAVACIAGKIQARTLEVGSDKSFKLPSAAIAEAKPGDTVSIGPGEYFDCATLRADRVTVEGAGPAEKVVVTDKVCGGKGIFIITGNGNTVRNLTLTRARVPDGNGAGIRNEAPDLTIDNVRFINNQNGILSTPPQPGTIVIRNSRFERNGTCANSGGCAHGGYFNAGHLLRIENSVFTGQKEGHQLKSRSERTEVVGCTLEDGEEGNSSYLIDVPNGGSLVVSGSTLQKGPHAENRSAAIVVGAEGVSQQTREITIEGNTFRNETGGQTVFVNNLTATDAVLRGNRLAGSVKPLSGDGKVTASR